MESMGTAVGARAPRWTRAAVGVVAVLGVAGIAAACGGGSSADQLVTIEADDPAATPSEALARAAELTGAVESGRIRVAYHVEGSDGAEPMEISFGGEGAFSDFGEKTELTIELSDASFSGGAGDVPGSLVTRQIVDGSILYMKVEGIQGIDGRPGLGAGWMRIDASETAAGTDALGGGIGGVGVGAEWSGFLESLKGAGATVVESGTDTIDGQPVTIYEGMLDPEAALAEASPDEVEDLQRALDQLGEAFEGPFTAWVDGDGLLRRFELRVSVDQAGATGTMSVVVELYDFGAPITITPPPVEEVNDLGGIVEQLGSLASDGLGTA